MRLLLQGDNISTIVKAAGITVEPYWPSLFAKLFAKKSVEDLICNVGAGGCPGAVCSCSSQPGAATAAAVTAASSSPLHANKAHHREPD